jgi:hypothetical protein
MGDNHVSGHRLRMFPITSIAPRACCNIHPSDRTSQKSSANNDAGYKAPRNITQVAEGTSAPFAVLQNEDRVPQQPAPEQGYRSQFAQSPGVYIFTSDLMSSNTILGSVPTVTPRQNPALAPQSLMMQRWLQQDVHDEPFHGLGRAVPKSEQQGKSATESPGGAGSHGE